MKAKRPLLELVIARGLVEDRIVARSLIMQGRVLVDGQPSMKPGAPVAETSAIALLDPECPYVSRAGLKLKNFLLALGDAAPKIAGQACLDLGSSTGGFTEVLLEHGAAKVFAVDVGVGQLDGRLRGHPRIVLLEGVNARALNREMIPEACAAFTIDVSFTSAVSLLPAITPLLSAEAHGLVLIKPQFERDNDAEDEKRGWFAKGVVRSPELHRKVLNTAYSRVRECGFGVMQVRLASPAGAKGNREFFLYIVRSAIGMGEEEFREAAFRAVDS